MIYKISDLDIETRASIYSKCIYIVVNNDWKKDIVYNLEGIEFNFNDALNICHYVIRSYGNNREKKKYNSLYGDKDIKINKEYEKKLYYERLKKIFDIRFNSNCSHEMLKHYAKLFKLKIADFSKLSYEYYVDYLKYSPMEFNWLINKSSNCVTKMSFSMLLEMLRKFDNQDDIVYIIDYSGYDIFESDFSKIYSYVKRYCSDLSDYEQESIINDLKRKLRLYLSLKNKASKKAVIDKDKYIRDYVESDYSSVSDYCSSIGIKGSRFDEYLRYVKKNNRMLYNLYLVKLNKDYYKVCDDKDIYIYKLICYWIINGYNGRKIDMLDLFSIPGFSFKKLEAFTNKAVFRKERDIIINFISTNSYRLSCMLLEPNNIKIDIKTREKINDYLISHGMDFSLFYVVLDRLDNGISLDSLLVDMFNYFNKEKNGRVKEKRI